MNTSIFRGYGIRVKLPTKSNESDIKARYKDAFHIVKETLTRIGVASEKSKTLYQTAHILHKRGEYAILHFKELFEIDRKSSNLNQEDINRRNMIVKLLTEYGLVELIDPLPEVIKNAQLKVLSFQESKGWFLKPKYNIGSKKTT